MKSKLIFLAALLAAIFMLSSTQVLALTTGEETEESTTEATTEATEEAKEEPTEETTEETTEPTEEETTAPTEEETTAATEEEEDKCLYQVTVVNLADEGKTIADLSRAYELKSILGAEAAVKYHLEHVLKGSGFVVAQNFLGAPYIEMEADEAIIYVHPELKTVQVLHELYACDGKVTHRFLEAIEVPYMAKLDKESAPELLRSQIQAVSGKGYALKKIEVKDYEALPYKVYDLDGKEVTPEPELATIYLFYIDKACEDGAEVAATVDTEAKGEESPVLNRLPEASEQLPATGDRSMLAFLLASALMAAGIFLFKKW